MGEEKSTQRKPTHSHKFDSAPRTNPLHIPGGEPKGRRECKGDPMAMKGCHISMGWLMLAI